MKQWRSPTVETRHNADSKLFDVVFIITTITITMTMNRIFNSSFSFNDGYLSTQNIYLIIFIIYLHYYYYCVFWFSTTQIYIYILQLQLFLVFFINKNKQKNIIIIAIKQHNPVIWFCLSFSVFINIVQNYSIYLQIRWIIYVY